MGFLDNDLVNKAKEQYGGQAADAAQQAAGKVIGNDAAGNVVGGLSGALGIRNTAAAPATDAQDSGGDAQGSDQSDGDDSSDDDSSDDDNNS
jgi:hypothetical protein